MKRQGAARQIRSIIEPLEKLKRALDGCSEALLVLERDRAIYANPLAKNLLGIREVCLESDSVEDWGLDDSLFATLERAIDVCSSPGKQYCELFTLADSLYELHGSGSPGELMTIRLRQIEKPTPIDWDQGAVEVADTSHHHNNLLTAIMGLTELLSHEVPPEGRASELLNEILKTASRRTRFYDSAPGEGGVGVQRLDPAAVLSELTALLRFSLPSVIKLRVDTHDCDCSVDFCGLVLRKLFLIVMTEAAREIRAAGVLSAVMKSNEDNLSLQVECRCKETDLGPVDDFRLRETREICEVLGGQLVIWSEGKRRVRIVNFPLKPRKPKPAASSPTNPLQDKFGAGKTILLVDDDDAIRAIGSAALSRLGFSVQVAKDGLEAVEAFEQASSLIDLVLLDLVMPRLGGAGCFEKLKAIDPDVQVVLMSGFTPNNRVNDLLAKGCLYFLRKPFELTELVSAVREATLRK